MARQLSYVDTAVSARTYAKFGPLMKDYHYTGMWAGPPDYNGKFDVEDYSTGFVRFGRKATLSFEVAWAANVPDQQYVDRRQEVMAVEG